MKDERGCVLLIYENITLDRGVPVVFSKLEIRAEAQCTLFVWYCPGSPRQCRQEGLEKRKPNCNCCLMV
jgi:hypothetical protein